MLHIVGLGQGGAGPHIAHSTKQEAFKIAAEIVSRRGCCENFGVTRSAGTSQFVTSPMHHVARASS